MSGIIKGHPCCYLRDMHAISPEIHAEFHPSPRVLARITEEEDGPRYRARCESCAFSSEDDGGNALEGAAHSARFHAVTSGHAVLVEAL